MSGSPTLDPNDSTGQLLLDSVVYNADIIERTEGKTRHDAEYLALCALIDDLRTRERGSTGIRKLQEVVAIAFPQHSRDLAIYIDWADGKARIDEKALTDLLKRHRYSESSGPSEVYRAGDPKIAFSRLVEKMDEHAMICVYKIVERWKYFYNTFVFKDGVPLAEKIRIFSMPVREFVANNFPMLLSHPGNADEMLINLVISAVYLAKTHPNKELEDAFRELLGAPL